MATQNEIEERLSSVLAALDKEEDRAHIVRALIHRAVHFAAEKRGGIEFCHLAAYLGEMVGHAHKLMHGDSPASQAHKEMVH